MSISKSNLYGSNTDLMSYGKLPPQVRELEEAVIGAILIEKNAITEVESFMTADAFYLNQHALIYTAITNLRKKDLPIDLLTVTEELHRLGTLEAVGGPFAISQITNKVGSAANVSYHARIVYEKYILRSIIAACSELTKQSYEETTDLFQLLSLLEEENYKIQQMALAGRVQNLKSLVTEAAKRIEDAIKRAKEGTFIKSKHSRINLNLGGWLPGKIIIVAARPAMGKTSWMISELLFLVKSGVKCMAFNGEMLEEQFMLRSFCWYSEIPNYRAMHHNFRAGEEGRWLDAETWLKNQDEYLTLDFTSGIHIDELVSKIRKVKKDKGLDVVFIDFLQDINYPEGGRNRDEILGSIMKKLKNVAKTERVCLVVLCHVTRKVESTKDRRPTLSDLRESGNIENYADAVLFMVRPDYYVQKDASGNPIYASDEERALKDICQVYGDKNRDGAPFAVDWQCSLGINHFRDIANETPEVMATQLELIPSNKEGGFKRIKPEDITNSPPPPDEDLPF